MKMSSLIPMYDLKSILFPPCSLASGAKVSRASVSDLQQKTIHMLSLNHHVLYIICINRLLSTRSLWLCLSNLLVTAETLIAVTGSSVTFDKIFRHRTLQMLILLDRNTGMILILNRNTGKTPNASSFLTVVWASVVASGLRSLKRNFDAGLKGFK